MNLIKTLLIFLLLIPGIGKAEIWMYQVQGKQISDCTKRPEINIDEIWNSLEEFTGLQFDIARDTKLIPGYVLHNQEHNKEYVFYPSKHACDFERKGIAVMLSGNKNKINQLANQVSKEAKLAAMSPSDIAPDHQQDWVNAFAGCTDGILQNQQSLKGFLQNAIDRCDCAARKIIELENKGISEELTTDILTDIMKSCS